MREPKFGYKKRTSKGKPRFYDKKETLMLKVRKSLNITQTEMAKLLGVCLRKVRALENEAYFPDKVMTFALEYLYLKNKLHED